MRKPGENTCSYYVHIMFRLCFYCLYKSWGAMGRWGPWDQGCWVPGPALAQAALVPRVPGAIWALRCTDIFDIMKIMWTYVFELVCICFSHDFHISFRDYVIFRIPCVVWVICWVILFEYPDYVHEISQLHCTSPLQHMSVHADRCTCILLTLGPNL